MLLGIHRDAVDRTGWHAQVAAAAQRLDHGVHPLGGADDRVQRAGGDAFGAADAKQGIDPGDVPCTRLAAPGIQCRRRLLQQDGEPLDTGLAARRAAVDRRFTERDGLGIGLASVVAALGALGLGQQGVDALDEAVWIGGGGHGRIIEAGSMCRRV